MEAAKKKLDPVNDCGEPTSPAQALHMEGLRKLDTGTGWRQLGGKRGEEKDVEKNALITAYLETLQCKIIFWKALFLNGELNPGTSFCVTGFVIERTKSKRPLVGSLIMAYWSCCSMMCCR